jgi:hypothetical protein
MDKGAKWPKWIITPHVLSERKSYHSTTHELRPKEELLLVHRMMKGLGTAGLSEVHKQRRSMLAAMKLCKLGRGHQDSCTEWIKYASFFPFF